MRKLIWFDFEAKYFAKHSSQSERIKHNVNTIRNRSGS